MSRLIILLMFFSVFSVKSFANQHEPEQPIILPPLFNDDMGSQIFRCQMMELIIDHIEIKLQKIEDPILKSEFESLCFSLHFYLGLPIDEGD